MLTFKQFLNEKIISNPQRHNLVGTIARNRYERVVPQMNRYTDEENTAIKHYAHVGSSVLTSKHLKHPDLSDADRAFADEIDDHVSSAIKKNRLPRNMFVYHGAGFDPFHLPKNPEGKHVLHNPTYLSTSLSLPTASWFSRRVTDFNPSERKNILRIHAPKGTHVGYIGHDPTESEFILHKGHKLHIDPKPFVISHQPPQVGNIPSPHDKRSLYHVWNAHLVHDGVD